MEIIREISLEALQNESDTREDPLLTIAITAQYWAEPTEALMGSLLEQTGVRVQLLIVDNGAPGYNAGKSARSIIVHRQPGFGETSSLASAEVIDAPSPFLHSQTVQLVRQKALGEFVLFLLQDECFADPLVLQSLAPYLHNISRIATVPHAVLALPVAACKDGPPANFNGTPLDALIIPTPQMGALKIDDACPTLRLALTRAAHSCLPVVRLQQNLLYHAEECPIPNATLFAGQCNYTVTHRLLKTISLLKENTANTKELYVWQAKLRDIVTRRTVRGLTNYWGLSHGEKSHFRLIEALLYSLDAFLLGLVAQDAFLQALDALFHQISATGQSKIHIAFLAQEYTVWPSLQPVYQHCVNDPRFEATLVYVPFSADGDIVEEEIRPYQKQGLTIIPYSSFNIKEENLDVIVLLKAYDVMPPGYQSQDLAAICENLSYVPYHISLFGTRFSVDRTVPSFDVFYSGQPVQTLARYFVVDSPGLAGHTAAHNLRNGTNLLAIGHPRMDLYREKQPAPPLPEPWRKKIENRTVFLYNSHHTEEYSTFFDYYEELFAFFARQKEIALIWRPHPLMKDRLISRKQLTEKQWNKIVKKTNASHNIIFDDSPEYHTAFYYANALITDISSLLAEYMFLNRPILVTCPKKDTAQRYDHLFGEELLAGTERAFSFDEIKSFIEHTKTGQDEKKALRSAFLKEGLYGFGTSVSQSFADAIYNDLTDPQE